jgi:hypothetical protein
MKKNFILTIFLSLQFNILFSQIIFRESFDYPVGNLQELNGGVGFSSKWDQNGTDAPTSMAASTNAQIVAGNINNTFGIGNRVQITLESGKSCRFDRQIPLTTLNVDAQEYWLGFWYRSTTTHDATTVGLAGQLILMNGANSNVLTDMRLGFGKTSNIASVNSMTAFTRAAPNNCGAFNWPNTTAAANALNVSSQGTYYVLVKITKAEFVNYNIGTISTPNLATLDGIRVWFLTQPPTGITDPIFTTKPLGDITSIDANTNNTIPIQARSLRGGADNTGNVGCKKDGITGIRLRVEGTSTTPFNVEFDEIVLSTTLESILPANFKNFEVLRQQNFNLIKFSTTNEINTKNYEIQSSFNGIDFNTIGIINSNNNAITTNEYSFLHENPLYNKIWYRIKQVDKDGNYQFSNTIKIDNKQISLINVFPNPIIDFININLKPNIFENNIEYVLINSVGKNILTGRLTSLTNKISTSHLKNGVYYLVIYSNKKIIYKQSFVK